MYCQVFYKISKFLEGETQVGGRKSQGPLSLMKACCMQKTRCQPWR